MRYEHYMQMHYVDFTIPRDRTHLDHLDLHLEVHHSRRRRLLLDFLAKRARSVILAVHLYRGDRVVGTVVPDGRDPK